MKKLSEVLESTKAQGGMSKASIKESYKYLTDTGKDYGKLFDGDEDAQEYIDLVLLMMELADDMLGVMTRLLRSKVFEKDNPDSHYILEKVYKTILPIVQSDELEFERLYGINSVWKQMEGDMNLPKLY